MFFRLHTDGTRTDAYLEDAFAGPTRTACWLIGGGPSLAELPCAAIARSAVPKFAVNLAGTKLLRPTFWTSYDPSARFLRSIYLDASVTKFVHARRGMDLVPETTFKVCECPATFFFERDPQRGFADFLSRGGRGNVGDSLRESRPLAERADYIVDWNDSLVQAIDIAYRLGFRALYLAGCEMFVRPSAEQIACAARKGVKYEPRETLQAFFERCSQAGLTREDMERLESPVQYHFDEHKPLAAAINTDLHYFRVAQYLRLVRRSLSLAGMELISVTPVSRLNDYFEHRSVEDVLGEIERTVGDPATEPTRGLYSRTAARGPTALGPMRDYRPHHWPKQGAPREKMPPADPPAAKGNGEVLLEQKQAARNRLRAALDELPEIPVHIDEVG